MHAGLFSRVDCWWSSKDAANEPRTSSADKQDSKSDTLDGAEFSGYYAHAVMTSML